MLASSARLALASATSCGVDPSDDESGEDEAEA